MTLNLILDDQPPNRAYPLDLDLMRGFTASVNNNQHRMAMEYLVEILKRYNLAFESLNDPQRPEGQEKRERDTPPPSRSRAKKEDPVEA